MADTNQPGLAHYLQGMISKLSVMSLRIARLLPILQASKIDESGTINQYTWRSKTVWPVLKHLSDDISGCTALYNILLVNANLITTQLPHLASALRQEGPVDASIEFLNAELFALCKQASESINDPSSLKFPSSEHWSANYLNHSIIGTQLQNLRGAQGGILIGFTQGLQSIGKPAGCWLDSLPPSEIAGSQLDVANIEKSATEWSTRRYETAAPEETSKHTVNSEHTALAQGMSNLYIENTARAMSETTVKQHFSTVFEPHKGSGSDARMELVKLQAKHDETLSELRSAQGRLDTQFSSIQTLRETLTANAQQIKGHEETIRQKAMLMSYLERDCEELKKTLASKEGQASTSSNRNDDRERQENSEKFKQWEAKYVGLAKLYEQLRSEHLELVKKYQEVQIRAFEMEKQKKNLEAEMKLKESEVADLIKDVEHIAKAKSTTVNGSSANTGTNSFGNSFGYGKTKGYSGGGSGGGYGSNVGTTSPYGLPPQPNPQNPQHNTANSPYFNPFTSYNPGTMPPNPYLDAALVALNPATAQPNRYMGAFLQAQNSSRIPNPYAAYLPQNTQSPNSSAESPYTNLYKSSTDP